MKTRKILKELIIILLLILAIVLVLGVILYEYVPTNKIIPQVESYTTPAEVEAEIDEDSDDEDSPAIVYKVEKSELTNYERIQEYVPGKKNPFSSGTKKTSSKSGNSTDNSSSGNSGNSSNTNSTGGNSSTDEDDTNDVNNTGYLPDRGTK